MKLLIVSQYFWPETFIINGLARTLAQQGHELVVVTGKPNYPEGAIHEGYQRAGVVRERFAEQVEVIRVPLRPRMSGGALNILRNYASFVFSGLLRFPWLLRGRAFDGILVFAPSPITAVIPAIVLKYSKRAHLALWVQDLWPESLLATGFVKNRQALRAVGLMVRGLYACCDTLLLQSQAFVAPVRNYAPARKLVYYPNPVDPAFFQQVPGASLPQALETLMGAHFCVVFAGNLGTAQALECIVEAARLLLDVPAVRVLLVGSGSRSKWLKQQIAAAGLDNLVMAGRYPVEVMPALFQRADALLVTLKDDEIFAQTIPSKVQAYLAAGRPLIAALNGEGARVVEEAQAGLTCAAEDAEALAGRIRQLYVLTAAERASMGQAGRAYALEHFEMGRQAMKLVEILKLRIAQGTQELS